MELANLIVEAVLKEAVTDRIVIYGGRFQPFHRGHKKVYDSLVAKFGSKNVYIATSDIQDGDKSPLSFNEKKEIATKLFNIPSSKFVKVKQPYQPVEILRGYDEKTTALIVAVGEKDNSRLGGAYFKPYKSDKDLKGYGVNAYVYTQLPSNSFGATDVRNMFRNKRMGDKRKQSEFEKFFGKFDKTIYNKLDKKLNEGVDTDNRVPGGKADNLTLVDIAKKYAGDYYDYRNVLELVKKELKKGIKIELEHTSDVKIAAEIAKDHIAEDLKYYDKLAKIENPKKIKEENPTYQPDKLDLENILDFEFSDPATGSKYTIKQALKLPSTSFARQEAMRLLRVLIAKNHVSGGGNLSKKLFPPGEDEPKNKLNLSLGLIYGEDIELDEASARGSGYDNKTLDKLIKNPETGEQVKVRSALNYDKNHPAYKAAMMLVRKVNAKLPHKKTGSQRHPIDIKKDPAARAHTQPTTSPVVPTNNAPKQPSKIQPAAGRTQPPVQKSVPLDKVKQDIPNFNVGNKSDIDKITPDQQKKVSMKIDQLAHAAKDAKEKGEKAPNFNLCDITIPGTNLYCGGNKGIERAKMPQFKGTPQPGSEADKMQKDKNGEVDTEEMFKKMLQDKGIKVSEPTSVPADQLKATQTELVGAKVAGMTKALEADPNHPGITAPIYVSSDGYVLDGHHRWAAVTSHEIASGRPANMNVRVIDMPIEKLVDLSNQFAQDIGVQAKAADANKETPTTGLAPTSSKEKTAKGAGVGKVTTKAVQNPEVVKRAIKSKIQKWSDKEKQFFKKGEHKPNSPMRRSIGEAINSKIKGIVPSIKREMEHLGHEFKSAGQGIGNLFNGKPLSDEQKVAFKSLGKTVAISALGVAIGGGIGHGAAVFMKHLGGHMAEHVVAELIGGGIGKAAIFAGTEMDGDIDRNVEWFTLYFAKQMKDGEIPADVWEMALQDYNNDKEDGKIHEDDWDRPEQQNEVLTEMSSSDVHFKNIMKHYKSAKYTKRINMYLFGRPNLKSSPNDVARELRNMGYNEITAMEKELNIEDLDEDINVDVNKGDEVLMGKFKNKKVVVKDLGKDQHGMPTINGKQATTFRQVDEGLIMEGGAYGHMNHPFDIRMNLSFGDLKNIVNSALDGNLGVVREKTDGQALAISWKNGRLIAARNKGHLANAGANAMDINGVAGKFGGRGGLTDAYNFAMKDLENAIRGLSQAQKDKIFKNGKCFVNLEVIWPTSVNVIPYNQALLVFHNAVEYNDAGNPIAKVDGAESVLGGMIKQINAHVQSKYTIQGPPIVELPKNKTLSSQKGKFNAMISKLQSEFGLTDKDGVADYHQAWWENFVDKSKKKIKPLEKAGLVKRWAFDDKSFRIGDITDDVARTWAEGIEKGPKATIMAGNLRKFEDIFLGVGAQVLSFMSSVLTAQPDKALQSMRKELETTANQIMNGGTITQIKKLEKELSRLNAIGGFEKIVPSEGIVFQYKGNAYKLTGAFAPLNQILGIFKFSR